VRPIVIAAGGTGGHFFPAEAFAATLLAHGKRLVLLTDARTSGQDSAAFANAERFVLAGAGIAGRGLIRGARATAALAAGTAQATRILARLDPAAVVAFGGYPAVAPVLAAKLLRRRIPVVLHEQNAVLGRANRALATFADVLALSFAETARVPESAASELVGNPVRPAVAALANSPYAPPAEGPVRLLVTGGSLGARVFGTLIPAALAALPAPLRARLRLSQQVRTENLEDVRRAYADAGIAADLATFFPDIAERLGAAHLVIGRAGASTVAELTAAGRPSILIPLPGAIDDHQAANAAALADAGAAWAMKQATLTPDTLAAKVAALLASPEILAAAAAAAAALGRVEAAATLAGLVEGLIRPEVAR